MWGCPPRLRGGVPSSNTVVYVSAGSSPPTRGCSRDRPSSSGGEHVLPAYAGVFPWSATRNSGSPRPPRLRGGVPLAQREDTANAASSPPTRGCSSYRHARHGVLEVLPAYAGVFLRSFSSSTSLVCPPRLRGGVPSRSPDTDLNGTSSPPTRGCSPHRVGRRLRRGVLPAYAGVFLPSGLVANLPPCPPRLRGGVPDRIAKLRGKKVSSPPTRGCSAGGGLVVQFGDVLPAYAGVFLFPPARPRPSSRPPRLRGGVPSVESLGFTVLTSSPPTRGCSRAVHDPAERF